MNGTRPARQQPTISRPLDCGQEKFIGED